MRAVLRRSSGAAVFAMFILVWQLAVIWFAADATTVASPAQVLATAMEPAMLAGALEATRHTVVAALIGWLLALGFGGALGLWLGSARRAWYATASSIELLRALPPIALVSPLVLVFGFSISMEIAVIFYGCLWPVLVNTALGVRQIPRQIHETAQTLQLRRPVRLLSVTLPWAAPAILVGARLAMSLAVILAVVAEMVGNPQGIGYRIVFYQQALNPGALYLYIVIAGVVAIALNAALAGLARLWAPVSPRRGTAT